MVALLDAWAQAMGGRVSHGVGKLLLPSEIMLYHKRQKGRTGAELARHQVVKEVCMFAQACGLAVEVLR